MNGGAFVEQDLESALAQVADEFVQGAGDTRSAVFADQADCLERYAHG